MVAARIIWSLSCCDSDCCWVLPGNLGNQSCQTKGLASLMFSILISPPLHIQMAALLSFKSSKKQNKNTRSFAKINSGPNPLLLKDAKIVILAHCRIQKRSKSFFLCSITILIVHSTRFCSAALSWACWLHADYCFWMTLLTMNPAFDYLWFALVAFYAKVPHWAGAPWSNLVPKCQPLGGLSCPVVAQLVTLPTLCLKALTFIRHHRAARGGVTFAFFFSSFFLPGGKHLLWYPVWGNKATIVEMVKKVQNSCSKAGNANGAFALV